MKSCIVWVNRHVKSLTFVFALILSFAGPFFIEKGILNLFTSTTNIVQHSEESLLQLQINVARLKGLQTQFGFFSDFLRFEFKVGNEAVLTFSTDNEFVNNALATTTGFANVQSCTPLISGSWPIEDLEVKLSLVKESLTEECLKKIMGVDDKIIKTHIKNEAGPTVSIYPDTISQLIIYLFCFAFWNALLLLFLNVYKNLLDITKSLIET